MNLSEARNKFVDLIKNKLMGFELQDNTFNEQPLNMFFTGFLFPIVKTENSLDLVIDSEDDENSDMDNKEAKIVKKNRYYIPPSSVGFSFFIIGEAINLRVFFNAVNYKTQIKDKQNQKFIKEQWQKNKLSDDGVEIEFTPKNNNSHMIFDNQAKLDVLWRKYHNGYIATITISNNQKIANTESGKQFNIDKNEKTLFEVELKCIIDSGDISVYPIKNMELLSDEEKEIEFRYKDIHTYAVGHGAAANWKENKQGNMEVWADFMPMVEVPQVTANTGVKNDETLEFAFLENDTSKEVINKLEIFINNYQIWIEDQNKKANQENEEDKNTAKKIIKNLDIAKERMQQGIELLKNDNKSRIAFSTMNKAMLMQWISADENKGNNEEKSSYKWRPFQLAFILMVLESSINEDSDYRDTLDLIWFPTGGGKTEAYLGIMAFLFIYRRLKYTGSSNGTICIMRYTLRLLTSQQFLRANKVIFALELIRQKDERFGDERFSSGLWVGSAISANSFIEAKKMLENKKYDKFVLNNCPWCNDKFTKNNYKAKNNDFYFICTNNKCDFGKTDNNILPCNVVDEALYNKPPSLLLSTVDKFARLTWEERAGSFLGKDGSRPPELIIQDELHLISGALGSIVGLYEAGIDVALISKGIRIKYIASTATIKNAKKQIQTLFARAMSIFPPSGLRYDDSYFAKTVSIEKEPGRLYVGYLAPLLDRQHCLEPLAGALLSAPTKLFKDYKEYLDNWWTQIIYHGSLKGVGNSRTLYQSGIKSYLKKITLDNLKNDIKDKHPEFLLVGIKTLEDFRKITNNDVKSIVDQYLPIRELNIQTLTSRNTAKDNAIIFNNLSKQKHEASSIDVSLATNMISVGLDVSRLALMIINGQPLTTAEYIQASSRVGRGEVPGIVFVNYYKTQARSLSHYENFRSYHDSFYRFVEPSSLTPFTYQARKRALHTAIIIAIRYGGTEYSSNKSAGNFDKDNEEIKNIIKELKTRCATSVNHNEESKTSINNHIDTLLSQWDEEIKYCNENRRDLVYNSNDRSFNNLICSFDSKNGLWQTLNSMRNVEKSAFIKVLKGLKQDEK